MATRSTIALEFADGSVGQVYCHWDGYLAHNGDILMRHYQDPYKVRELIDLGSLSSLGPEIGEKHEFGNPHVYNSVEYHAWNEVNRKFCTFYARERGEDLVSHTYKDFSDYKENHQYEEYEYILRKDGRWYVSEGGDNFITLAEALVKAQVPV